MEEEAFFDVTSEPLQIWTQTKKSFKKSRIRRSFWYAYTGRSCFGSSVIGFSKTFVFHDMKSKIYRDRGDRVGGDICLPANDLTFKDGRLGFDCTFSVSQQNSKDILSSYFISVFLWFSWNFSRFAGKISESKIRHFFLWICFDFCPATRQESVYIKVTFLAILNI